MANILAINRSGFISARYFIPSFLCIHFFPDLVGAGSKRTPCKNALLDRLSEYICFILMGLFCVQLRYKITVGHTVSHITHGDFSMS